MHTRFQLLQSVQSIKSNLLQKDLQNLFQSTNQEAKKFDMVKFKMEQFRLKWFKVFFNFVGLELYFFNKVNQIKINKL